jgi:coenzyme F420 hydrogenase subunit beta
MPQKTHTPVVPKHLCYGCGVCVANCPQNAIDLKMRDNDVSFALIDTSKCNNCGICTRICPSNGWDDIHILSNHSKSEYDLCLQPYMELGFGYSINCDMRERGASGGMASSILVYLLEQKKVDGVIIPQETGILDGEYQITSNKLDIIRAQRSKYFQIPLVISTNIIKKYKNLALIGLPCHIEAINRAMIEDPDLKCIKYKICLFCGHSLYKVLYDYLFKKKNIIKSEIKKIEFRPRPWWNCNFFNTFTKDKKYSFSLKRGIVRSLNRGRLFTREACLLCPDFSGRFSDISLGDAWHPKFKGSKEGYNSYIIRSKIGKQLIDKLEENNIIYREKSNLNEFYKMSFNSIIFKHEGVKERATFLKASGMRTPKNIPLDNTIGNISRSMALYYGRKIFFFTQRKKILAYLPIKLVIFYGLLVMFLSRKRKLDTIRSYIMAS